MLFFAIFVTDVDGGLDRDIFDINEGLWIILLFYFILFFHLFAISRAALAAHGGS